MRQAIPRVLAAVVNPFGRDVPVTSEQAGAHALNFDVAVEKDLVDFI